MVLVYLKKSKFGRDIFNFIQFVGFSTLFWLLPTFEYNHYHCAYLIFLSIIIVTIVAGKFTSILNNYISAKLIIIIKLFNWHFIRKTSEAVSKCLSFYITMYC